MRESILKVCFVLDCTGSMGPWIEAAKYKIRDILKKLKDEHPNFKIYVALAGYRDFGESYTYIKFTEDYGDIYDGLDDIIASGGDDEAEDVASAYHWVTSLNWSADVRAVFHITDAPNHGVIYHDADVTDDYPAGNPTIDLLEEVHKLATYNVDLTVFRISKDTDIMYGLFMDEYDINRFRVVEFIDSNDTEVDVFYNEITTQLHNSMSLCPPTD